MNTRIFAPRTLLATPTSGTRVFMAEQSSSLQKEMISPAKKLCTSAVSRLRRVAIEGNIGEPPVSLETSSLSLSLSLSVAAGKSTFLRLLRESSPAYHVISEPITKWQSVDSESGTVTASQQSGGNLLDLFYRDPERWAYTFQVTHTFSPSLSISFSLSHTPTYKFSIHRHMHV